MNSDLHLVKCLLTIRRLPLDGQKWLGEKDLKFHQKHQELLTTALRTSKA